MVDFPVLFIKRSLAALETPKILFVLCRTFHGACCVFCKANTTMRSVDLTGWTFVLCLLLNGCSGNESPHVDVVEKPDLHIFTLTAPKGEWVPFFQKMILVRSTELFLRNSRRLLDHHPTTFFSAAGVVAGVVAPCWRCSPSQLPVL